MRIVVATVATLLLLAGPAAAQEKDNPGSPAIENGSKVSFEYTLMDEAGKVIETSKGRDPLSYTQGGQQIIPGLEKALTGMRAGEEKKVTVKPEEGYGPLDPKAQVEVPKTAIPPEALKVGTTLQGRSPSGAPQMARVKEVKEKTVVLDLNHPLAGQTLVFEVKIVGVEPPKK